jgi:hypothetical protein
MAPSSRLQFPFPLLPTSLARFPSTTTFCPSAPLVCSVTARLVADTPWVSWPAASSAQPFLGTPTFVSEISSFQGEVLPEFLVPKIDFQGEVLSNFPLQNIDFPGEVLPKFSALTTHFSRGGSAKIFCADHQFSGGGSDKIFLSHHQFSKGKFRQTFWARTYPFLTRTYIYIHKQILILTEEEYFDPCSWW